MKNLGEAPLRPGTVDPTGAEPSAGPRGGETDASTRQRVARSILEHGPSTAAVLAERLGLTAAAVRRHLDVLLERGLLVAREQRVYGTRGRGRPAKVFALSDAGRADFYSAYDDLAIAALDFLGQESGPTAVARFASTVAAPAETRYREVLSAPTATGTPAQALAGALSRDGYAASVRPSVLGEQLCQHHCPVAHVAERFPQLCEVETEMFSRLLGRPVQRLATIAHGDGVCTTHVPRVPSSVTAPSVTAPSVTAPSVTARPLSSTTPAAPETSKERRS